MSTSNAEKFAAFLRRKATSMIAEGDRTSGVEDLLSAANDAVPCSENIRASIANTRGMELFMQR